MARTAFRTRQSALAMLVALALVALLFAVNLGGQAATDIAAVPMDRGNAARTGQMPGPGPDSRPHVRWRFGDAVVGTPAATGEGVYVMTRTGDLVALDAASGEERWRAPLGAGALPAPVAGAGVAGAVDAAGNLFMFDAATGAPRWRVPIPNGSTAPLILVESTIYLGDNASTLHALDALTGAEIWNANVPAGVAMLARHDDTVYVSGYDSSLVALEAENGDLEWQRTLAGQVTAAPAVHGDRVFVGSADGNVYALDRENGNEQWQFPTSNTIYLASGVVAETVYALDGNGIVHALAIGDGAERWRADLGPNIGVQAPQVVEGTCGSAPATAAFASSIPKPVRCAGGSSSQTCRSPPSAVPTRLPPAGCMQSAGPRSSASTPPPAPNPGGSARPSAGHRQRSGATCSTLAGAMAACSLWTR